MRTFKIVLAVIPITLVASSMLYATYEGIVHNPEKTFASIVAFLIFVWAIWGIIHLVDRWWD